MNRANLKGVLSLTFIIIVGFLGTKCATPKEGLKTVPKDYVYPLTEISLEKVFAENRGLRVLEENATKVHDFYRGGVQEKEEGERLLKESSWDEARKHLEKSNRFLRVVIKYLPEDEAHRDVYEGQTVIFLPNLLMADNDRIKPNIGKVRRDHPLSVTTASTRTGFSTTLQSHHVKLNVILDFNRKSSDHIESRSSLFVDELFNPFLADSCLKS